jgi:hypothetical protein
MRLGGEKGRGLKGAVPAAGKQTITTARSQLSLKSSAKAQQNTKGNPSIWLISLEAIVLVSQPGMGRPSSQL